MDQTKDNNTTNIPQSEETAKGGTLRLGAYPCRIAENTQMYRCKIFL